MCNCIPEHMNVESVKFDNVVESLGFNNRVSSPVLVPRLGLAVTFEINNTKTDKTKNKKSYVTMNYCPFCGEKYKSGDSE